MPAGAAEWETIKRTEGFSSGHKRLPFSGQEFLEDTRPGRGQAGSNVPGDKGHTEAGKPPRALKSSLALGSLAILLCLGGEGAEETGITPRMMKRNKGPFLRVIPGRAEKTTEPPSRLLKSL